MQKVFYLTSYLGVIMNNIKNEQSGFTLVELVIAVALVGVLSIVAIPKITGVSDDARQASVNGVAFSLGESSKRNYMIRGANNVNGFPVLMCDDPVEGLEGNTLPTGFALVAGSSSSSVTLATLGATLTLCSIETTTTPKKTATYITYGIA
jgi:prepilin-type N-terminal cleavage/methylation domain-containing protein